MGIYMVTSGCPVMGKLKPMVKFHLPFASGEETSYRMVTMYLLAQFFKYKNGKEPDWDLKNLVKIYDNCFADQIIFSITENVLKQFAGLFK